MPHAPEILPKSLVNFFPSMNPPAAVRASPLDLEHLQHFVAIVVDELHSDLARLGPGERPLTVLYRLLQAASSMSARSARLSLS